MSMQLSIKPTSQHLDMYGEPDASSGYSISGVVTVSVSSPTTLFDGRKPAKLLLQSLSLTFEGQSEIYTPNTGYSSLRLCSVTRELATEPMELSNEGHEDEETPCQWDVVFNLPIPGWLPATASLGIEDIGIRYNLFAVAKFVNIDLENSPSWLCVVPVPFRRRARYTKDHLAIYVRRFISPPQASRSEQRFINYLVNSKASTQEESSNSRIPSEILSKIQVLTSIPEVIDIKDCSIPVTIRMRTKGLDAENCKRLQPTEVGVDVIQQERTRYRPSSNFLAMFPLPPTPMQPPNLPLRDAHPLSNIYDVGLYIGKDLSESVCRTFTLLPNEETGKYTLAEDNYAFEDDAEPTENPTWYTIEAKIPFSHVSRAKMDAETEEWAGPAVIRPSTSSPLFGVSHDLCLSLTFTHDNPEAPGGKSRERLNFKIPLSFGHHVPRPPSSSPSSTEIAPPPAPSSIDLPPYFQLYDEHGEPKIDYSTPLPRYSPKEEAIITEEPAEPSAQSTTSLAVSDKPESHLPIGEDEPLLPL